MTVSGLLAASWRVLWKYIFVYGSGVAEIERGLTGFTRVWTLIFRGLGGYYLSSIGLGGGMTLKSSSIDVQLRLKSRGGTMNGGPPTF